MKLVLYCSNSVWPVKRKMHKKQIFLVGQTQPFPCIIISHMQERKGRGEYRNFEGDELCLGSFPWKRDKGKVKISSCRTDSSNKRAKWEVLSPFRRKSL